MVEPLASLCPLLPEQTGHVEFSLLTFSKASDAGKSLISRCLLPFLPVFVPSDAQQGLADQTQASSCCDTLRRCCCCCFFNDAPCSDRLYFCGVLHWKSARAPIASATTSGMRLSARQATPNGPRVDFRCSTVAINVTSGLRFIRMRLAGELTHVK